MNLRALPQANALLAGNIDITSGAGTGGLTASAYAAVQGNTKFGTLLYWDDTTFNYLSICAAPGHIFNDPRVREALKYAIDWQRINAAVGGGQIGAFINSRLKEGKILRGLIAVYLLTGFGVFFMLGRGSP